MICPNIVCVDIVCSNIACLDIIYLNIDYLRHNLFGHMDIICLDKVYLDIVNSLFGCFFLFWVKSIWMEDVFIHPSILSRTSKPVLSNLIRDVLPLPQSFEVRVGQPSVEGKVLLKKDKGE